MTKTQIQNVVHGRKQYAGHKSQKKSKCLISGVKKAKSSGTLQNLCFKNHLIILEVSNKVCNEQTLLLTLLTKRLLTSGFNRQEMQFSKSNNTLYQLEMEKESP